MRRSVWQTADQSAQSGLQSEARRQTSQILSDKLCLRIIGNNAAEDSRKRKEKKKEKNERASRAAKCLA